MRSSELIRRCGHLPITIRKDVPGFVENRVLYAVMRECLDLVEQGVIEPQDLDACVSWGIGYKLAVVGPMALLDMAGLDIYAAVASYLNKELSDRGGRRRLHHRAHRAGASSASRPAAASTTTLPSRSQSFRAHARAQARRRAQGVAGMTRETDGISGAGARGAAAALASCARRYAGRARSRRSRS